MTAKKEKTLAIVKAGPASRGGYIHSTVGKIGTQVPVECPEEEALGYIRKKVAIRAEDLEDDVPKVE